MAVLEVLWRQRVVVALILIVGIVTAIATTLSQKTKYQATATVLYTGHDASNSLALGPLDMATLVTSQAVTSRALRALHVDLTPAEFADAIVTRPAYQSNIMPITFTSTEPDLAVNAANALAHALRDYFLEITRTRFEGLSTYLDGALRKRQEQVVELDRKLDIASAGDPTLAEDGAANTLSARLNSLVSERDRSAAGLAGSQALAAADGPHLSAIGPLVRQQIAGNDYVYRQLQAQLALDAAQLASQRAQYTPAYPGLKGLAHKIAGEGDSVDARLSELSAKPSEESYAYVGALVSRDVHASLVASGQAEVSAIDREIAQVRDEIARLPSQGARLAALRRERDTARQAYETLAQRREILLAEQAQAATTGTIEIIDEARIASVSKKRALLLGIAAGLGFLLLAVTVAYLLDSADRRMLGIDSIAELYGKPIIGTIRAS